MYRIRHPRAPSCCCGSCDTGVAGCCDHPSRPEPSPRCGRRRSLESCVPLPHMHGTTARLATQRHVSPSISHRTLALMHCPGDGHSRPVEPASWPPRHPRGRRSSRTRCGSAHCIRRGGMGGGGGQAWAVILIYRCALGSHSTQQAPRNATYAALSLAAPVRPANYQPCGATPTVSL
jgi:hypothetical protein